MQQSAYRENKRKKSIKRRILALLLLILGIMLIAALIVQIFRVRKIEVSGNLYTDSSKIIEWVQKDQFSGNSLYLLMIHQLSGNDLPPYLEEAKVRLKTPGTITVEVVEKKMVGFLLLGEEGVYFDKEGLVVYKDKKVIEGVPGIEGLQISEAVLYKKLKVTDQKIFGKILEVTEALKNEKLAPDRIVCLDTGISLYLGAVCVQLGDENLSDRIAQIPSILEKLNGQGGTLHLGHFGNGGSNPSFVPGDIYAEQKAAEAAAAEQAAAEQAAAEQAAAEAEAAAEAGSEYVEEDTGEESGEEYTEEETNDSYDESSSEENYEEQTQ